MRMLEADECMLPAKNIVLGASLIAWTSCFNRWTLPISCLLAFSIFTTWADIRLLQQMLLPMREGEGELRWRAQEWASTGGELRLLA